MAGAVGVPVPEHRPGDCLFWGAWEGCSSARAAGSAAGVIESSSGNGWLPCAAPVVVADTAHLDIREARLRQFSWQVVRDTLNFGCSGGMLTDVLVAEIGLLHCTAFCPDFLPT